MTERGGQDEEYWRRPASTEPPARPPWLGPDEPASPTPAYTGPPPSTRPPLGWRPPVVVQPPPPRSLPAQDHAYLDVQEQSARTLTYGIGMVVGAILLVVFCTLCAGTVL
ncbi:MAG TPA: translation initiation factor 2 [Micromonosporaceae bacterium]|nr:translation initiation factor 2 [Micromonosporaceae bacterium]